MVYDVGVHKISFDEYLADPCPEPSLSRSTIRDIIFQCPAHAWFNHPRLNPNYKKEEDIKFDIGTAGHSILFEGIDSIGVIEAEDWRTKAAKEEREKIRKGGRTPLLRQQYDNAKEMVDVALKSIYECKELKITDLRTDGEAELSYLWKERIPGSESDIWLRARTDWITKDRKLILDYKTTGLSANPNEWGRQAINMGYDIQDSLYCKGVKVIEGTEPKMVFIIQEVEEPYLCSFIGLPPDFLDLGKSKVEYGMFLWQECMASAIWPGYPQQVCWANLPGWAVAAWELRAMQIGGIEENS